jgi:hypothetical protein
MQALKRFRDAPDRQVLLTDPEARSMATSDKGAATVAYNVQIAVGATTTRKERMRYRPWLEGQPPREMKKDVHL